MMMSDAQRTMMRTNGVLVGRALLGLVFLVAGYNKLMSEAGVSGFAGGLSGMGVPLPMIAAWLVVLVEILGGLALILGYRVGQAAAALSIFLLLTVYFVHNPFTNEKELGNALKNLALMGGMLYVLAYGAGDGWRVCKNKTSV